MVKTALADLLNEGKSIGVTSDEVSVWRWRGAKASLSGVMMHLGIKDRAVRFQEDQGSPTFTFVRRGRRSDQPNSKTWSCWNS